MDFLFHLLGLPFQVVSSIFHVLLNCFYVIIGLPFVVVALPIMLVWGFFKGVFGVLLSIVLFLGSPLGIGTHSELASSPQLAYQATFNSDSTFTTRIPEPEFFSHEPIRNAFQGQGCSCPYDFDKNGNQCGGRSAYSKPGGSEPRCYKDD